MACTKVLIVGGSGVIGSKFVKYLSSEKHETHYTFLSHDNALKNSEPHKLDAGNKEETNKLIAQIKPSLVIHTTALTDMDLCETNRKLADRVNIDSVRNIVDACKKVGSKIVYISTSAVFDGTKKAFTEEDTPCPINYYGFTKLEGEKIVSESDLPFLIVRTDQPYCWVESWQKKNFVVSVFEKLVSKEICKCVIDWYNTPTLVDNFIEVSDKLIKSDRQGIYHVVGSDFLNRYDCALKIAEVFGEDKKFIQPIRSQELNLVAKRGNTNLDNAKTRKDTGMKLFGIEDGLKILKQHK